jgi:hypothetical protein
MHLQLGGTTLKRAFALLLLMPALALAKSPFDCTWKMNLDSVKWTGKPEQSELIGGNYTCKSCVPPYTIKADGKTLTFVDKDLMREWTTTIEFEKQP